MFFPVIDLHCDLLTYLGNNKQRTPYDLAARCAIPQLCNGHVKLQILAIFTQTESLSVERGLHQARIYQELSTFYPQHILHFSSDWTLDSSLIGILPAFENASGFCKEEEPLQIGLDRLKNFIKTITKPLYISLTWNTENRFGGGSSTEIGLKEDGKNLLKELNQQSIAIDLSHASDALAYEVIDYMEGHRLNIPLMASHSNARSILSVPRNLPDEIAKEIFRRGGIVGLNLYRRFIGQTEDQIVRHVGHWLELGGEDHLAFGADFFYENDLPSTANLGKEIFLENYHDSSCYKKLLNLLQKELRLNPSFFKKIAHQNALNFIKKIQITI